MPMGNIPKFCVRWHTFLVKIPILLPLRQVEAWCFANIKDFSKTPLTHSKFPAIMSL